MRPKILLALCALLIAGLPAAEASAAKDHDGDALPDKWEKKKRTKTPTGLKLKKLGASWKHRDVFVEIDFASDVDRNAIGCSGFDAIYDAFRNAPLQNPDGKTGINLHLDAGVDCPSRSYTLKGNGSTTFAPGAGCSNPSTVAASAMSEKRVGVFRLAGVVNQGTICGGAAGVAVQNGVLSLVEARSDIDFAHVLMHELGHNFGLDHAPSDGPNRLTVMAMLLATGPTAQTAVDYQRYEIGALNEASLSEPAGLNAPAGEAHLSNFWVFWSCGGAFINNSFPASRDVNWSCNEDVMFNPIIEQAPVQADINGNGSATDVFPATQAEWPGLDYGAGGLIGRKPAKARIPLRGPIVRD